MTNRSVSVASIALRFFLSFSLTTALLFGQASSGRIEGTVMDATGALIPNAKVTARDVKRDVSLATVTGAEGRFVFPSLVPSTYQLTVQAAGFSKSVVDNIELNVSVTISQQIKLEVGSLTEEVVVSAESVHVNVSDAQLGTTITMKDIDTLPQLGRNPMSLAVFGTGVSIDPSDGTFSKINGARGGSNNAKLDGIDVNDAVVPRLGLSLTAVNVDSVGEFRIITNGGKAEYGRNAGGQIEMITRGGSNSYHGNAFEFLRNTDINANTFFNNSSGIGRPKFIQNIFGASFGGKIKRDRTFFYGNYQGTRLAQDTVRNRTVLTPEAKSGIFRYAAGGVTQSASIIALDPLGKGIDPFVKKNALDLLPSPNNTDTGDGLNTAGYRFNNPSGSYNDAFTIKVDHQLTANHRIFYRHSWFRTFSIDALNNADATFPGQPQGNQGGHRWGYGIGSDWNITSTLINEFRIGHQSASVAFNRPGRPAGPALQANSTDWSDPLLTNFAQGRNSPVYDFSDNLTKVYGKHTFKGGYTFRRIDQYGTNDAGIYPNYTTTTANGNAPTFAAPAGITAAALQNMQLLYNDLLGRVNQVTTTFYSDLTTFQAAGTGRVRDFVIWDHSFYFQDDWKVNRRLTINAGVRWELFGPPKEMNGFQGSLDQVAKVNATANIDNLAVTKNPNYYSRDNRDFAPRVGFAWDPFGNGRTAIRGSWGLFYDRIIGATASSVDGGTPGFSQAVNLLPNSQPGSDIRISTPAPLPTQPGAPVLLQPVTRNTSIFVFGDGLRNGYVHQANLTIQHEIRRGTTLQVGYVTTRGTRLFNWVDYNQPRVYGDFLGAFKELQAFNANPNAVPGANNTLVKIFGTPAAAVAAVGATSLNQGTVGTAADTVDRSNYTRYAAAGVSQFYLRNYPQFNQLWVGTSPGRSWYDSLQVSVRRSVGALQIQGNYTYSKFQDNVTAEGNGSTATIDNFNFNNNKARSDSDRPHAFNGSAIYMLPIGTGRFIGGGMPHWANKIVSGWELGSTFVWQTGAPYTVGSTRRTAASNINTWADYSGDRNIGSIDRRGNGVYFLDPSLISSFTFPQAGTFGNSGRNAFRLPRFFDTDVSIVKRFLMPWSDNHKVTFRAEMYNAFNNANFSGLGTSILTPTTFGKFSSIIGNQRLMQMALRYDF